MPEKKTIVLTEAERARRLKRLKRMEEERKRLLKEMKRRASRKKGDNKSDDMVIIFSKLFSLLNLNFVGINTINIFTN
jgi:hypothetical protein